jgi:hypothetical protein
MRTRLLSTIAVCVGIALGFVVTVAPYAEATRNVSGTYSLPTGNPVVSGTTITSSWANTTLADIGTEITNSLDRAGRGAMTGALQLANGSSSAPALTFGSESNSGIYKAGSNDVRMQVNSTNVQTWTGTLVTIPVGLTVTETTANGNGITTTANGSGYGIFATGGSTSGIGGNFTGGAPNGYAVAAYGDGTGSGVLGTGGDSSGAGGTFIGGTSNGTGISATGDGTGAGVTATGGDSNGNGVTATGTGSGVGVLGTGGTSDGNGVRGVGGATNGNGVVGQGTGSGVGGVFAGGASNVSGIVATGGGTGAGGSFANGTNSSGATPRVAVRLTNGLLEFNGVTAPDKDAALTNTLAPTSLVKAWAKMTSTGGSSATVTLNSGFNVTSATVSGTVLTLTFASAFASSSTVAVLVQAFNTSLTCVGAAPSTTTASVTCRDNAAGAGFDIQAGASTVFYVMALGAQ